MTLSRLQELFQELAVLLQDLLQFVKTEMEVLTHPIRTISLTHGAMSSAKTKQNSLVPETGSLDP